jgi:hypothetical protein
MPPEALMIKIDEMARKEAAEKAAEKDLFNAFAKADLGLMELAKLELKLTGNTTTADRTSRELNRLMALACEMEAKLRRITELIETS